MSRERAAQVAEVCLIARRAGCVEKTCCAGDRGKFDCAQSRLCRENVLLMVT